MKILIITPKIPYPPYRGDKLKIFNISKHLAEKNHVKILCFHENTKNLNNIPYLEQLGIEIETVKLSRFKSFFNLFTVIFSEIPFQVAYYSSPHMKNKIKSLLDKEDFDVIYFHLIRTAQYFESTQASTAVKVLDFTDAVSLYLSRFAEVIRNPFKKFAVKLELKRIQKYEKVSRKFDTLFVCSDKDKEYLQRRKIHPNIKILRNGFDADYFRPDDNVFEKHRIIFTGNMPYFPNSDAVNYFSKEIFPGVLKKYPDSKFYIVGQKPPRSVKKLESKNIVVTGFVEDIRHEYLKSELNVVPIRFGAGTLNKVIESLALGIPVVSTSLSILGFPDELKKYILVADDEKEFVEKISLVFESPAIRQTLINEGIETIRSLLSWEHIISNFENYLTSRVEK